MSYYIWGDQLISRDIILSGSCAPGWSSATSITDTPRLIPRDASANNSKKTEDGIHMVCDHCGQWGVAYSKCDCCGAPIPAITK